MENVKTVMFRSVGCPTEHLTSDDNTVTNRTILQHINELMVMLAQKREIPCLLHAKKDRAACALDFPALDVAFNVETCQRRFILTTVESLERNPSAQIAARKLPVDIYFGQDAYKFLLEICTGLHSSICGETEIFGQIKEKWRAHETSIPHLIRPLRPPLRPWMRDLFEDTKQIRTQWLQGMGGSSYGTLARRLLKAKEGDSVLVLGAGQIARSVVPYLLDHSIKVWNRSPKRLKEFHSELGAKARTNLEMIEDNSDLANAWQNSNHVVLCVPPDFEFNQALLALPRKQQGTVLHLGATVTEAGEFSKVEGFVGLDDLLSLNQAQNELRALQVGQAKKACREKTLSRFPETCQSLLRGCQRLVLTVA